MNSDPNDALSVIPGAADDSHLEQLILRVLEGIADADAGRMISTEELLQEVEIWTKGDARGVPG